MIANTSPSPSCKIYHSDDSNSCKEISDNDNVSRAFFTPRMGTLSNLKWDEIFQFPSEQGSRESVIWRAVLQSDNCVHIHNLAHIKNKKLSNPSFNQNYLGFFTSTVVNIRSKKTDRGHTFSVYHAPNEGEYHAEISVVVASGLTKLSRNDKIDVRVIMQKLFKPNFTPCDIG